MIVCVAAAVPSVVAGDSALAKDGVHLRGEAVLDLVAQVPARGAASATVMLSVADADTHAGAELRVRLHEPVRTREELWAAATGPAPTPESSSWVIPDWRVGPADGDAIVVSVPVARPDGSSGDDPAGAAPRGPRPLHIDLVAFDGTPIDTLRTFLLPDENTPDGRGEAVAVAVIVDLRLPPAHSPDGGATFDQAHLRRVLDIARVLIDHPDIPLTVHLSGETLDALALIGDDESLAVLRAAAGGRQLLASPWTSLDIDDWITAGRDDVAMDGLQRGREALSWAGLEASTVMHFDRMPSPAAAGLVTEPATGITGFVSSPGFNTPLVRPDPVTAITDAAGARYLTAQADPLLRVALRGHDPELAAQWALAELARIALAPDESRAAAVVVSALVVGWEASNPDEGGSPQPFMLPGADPATITLLLESLDAHSFLSPVTVSSLLATTVPGGAVAGAAQGRTPDLSFDLYMTERARTEALLGGYELLLGGESAGTLTAPLRTLMAASANSYLATGPRLELIEAVDRAVALGTTGVEFLGRGPITVTERSADVPVTLVNNGSAPVTVALALASDRIYLAGGERPVFTLEPGRNDLSVPVEATTSGRTEIRVTVTTPDEAGAIVLTTGAFSVRFTDAEGLGFLILLVAAGALAAWWLRTLRRRARDADRGGATVAAPGSGSDSVEARRATGTFPSSGDDTRT